MFTDIVGHTPLWDSHPLRMAVAHAEHDDLIESVVASYGGRVVKSTGDGVMAVFREVPNAVDAACDVQQKLARRHWPEIGQLQVRMAVHLGPAEERAGDFFGVEVIRAARMCAAAHGGQILASAAVAESTRYLDWIDLGEHRLRGLREPVAIRQACVAGLAVEFPPLATVDARPNTLPTFRTEFVGREVETAQALAHVERNRIVTLTGVGGSGKTRLAVEVAHASLGAFPDGVYFADLSGVRDGHERLWDVVRESLGGVIAPVRGSTSTQEAVTKALEKSEALLILDNCEHILEEAVDVVGNLLDAASSLRIVATSRERLHVHGEQVLRVQSLIEEDALNLLRARATAAGAVEVTDEFGRMICTQLDGNPLAIEFAAARCAQLGASAVAARLEDRLRLLVGPPGRTVSRHRAVRTALDWSYDLLAPGEQAALRRLSVFVGSFSLESAEAVLDERLRGSVIDLVGALVDKSLVEQRGDDRFGLLETIRVYATEKLDQANEADRAHEALRGWLIDRLTSFAESDLVLGTPDVTTFIAAQLDDIFGCIRLLADREDWGSVLRLATPVTIAGIGAYLNRLTPLYPIVGAALDADIDDDLRRLAWCARSGIAPFAGDSSVGDVEAAAALLSAGTDLPSVLGLSWLALRLDAFSRSSSDATGIARARAMVDRAHDIAAAVGPYAELVPLEISAALALNADDWTVAADRAEELIRHWEDHVGVLDTYHVRLAAIARVGDARPLAAETVRGWLARTRGWPDLVAMTDLMAIALGAPDLDTSHPTPIVDRDALDRADHGVATDFLISVAAIAMEDSASEHAARILAAVRHRGDLSSSAPRAAHYRILVRRVRDALDPEASRTLRAEGQAMSLADAIDAAMDYLTERQGPVHGRSTRSDRETQTRPRLLSSPPGHRRRRGQRTPRDRDADGGTHRGS